MKKVTIKNRSNGFVGYYIPEINLRRSFGPYESKEVDSEEIQKVIYQSGGQELVDAYFIIEDKELAATISPEVSEEPEYWMDKEDIKNVTWDFVVFPSQNFKDDFGAALLQYEQGTISWQQVKDVFVTRWQQESV